MAEKTGGLEKLYYDFPTEAVLEVSINGVWYRTTSKDFRSFDGPRRYTKPIQQPPQGMPKLKDLEFETIEHTNGKLFMFASNKEVFAVNDEKIVNSPYYEQTNAISASRT